MEDFEVKKTDNDFVVSAKRTELSDEVKRKLALPVVKIDVGSGDHNMKQPLDEWIRIDGAGGGNVDIKCDFGNIPLSDKCVDELWNGDVIEHIPMWRWDEVIGEWNRVMKVGGILAGQTPNLHRIMVDYTNGKLSLEDATNGLYGWHDSAWQQHYVTFTVSTLSEMLSKYGFGDFDFSESPAGSKEDNFNMSWWLCFKCKKTKDFKISL